MIPGAAVRVWSGEGEGRNGARGAGDGEVDVRRVGLGFFGFEGFSVKGEGKGDGALLTFFS